MKLAGMFGASTLIKYIESLFKIFNLLSYFWVKASPVPSTFLDGVCGLFFYVIHYKHFIYLNSRYRPWNVEKGNESFSLAVMVKIDLMLLLTLGMPSR